MSWNMIPLKELGLVITGSTPKTSERRFYGGDIPFVTPAELDSREPIASAAKTLTLEGADKATLVPPETVLVCCIGSLGKLGFTGREVAINQQINAVVFDTSRVDPIYGLYACQLLVPKLKAMASATTVSIVSKSKFESLSIPVPPLQIQREVAQLLQRAESLRDTRRVALAELDSLGPAYFVELFGDLGTNPRDWPITTVDELILEGPQNGLYKPASAYGNGTPILRIDSFYDGAVTDLAGLKRVSVSESEHVAFGLQLGDIVINRVNSIEYLGKCALIPELIEPTVFESNMMRLRVQTERVHPRYLTEALQTRFVKSQIQQCAKRAVNQASINQQDVKNFRVPLPPLSLQHEFARCAANIEKLKAAQRASLAELDALFASLQHRVFRGEL